MAELALVDPPRGALRLCPSCGEVQTSDTCAQCAPPDALNDPRSAASQALVASARRLVDSRRASAEWEATPDEVDPQTRKAHPAQLRASAPRPETEPPDRPAKPRRHTQLYHRGPDGQRVAHGQGPGMGRRVTTHTAPNPARAFLEEVRAETAGTGPTTARSARPVSPLASRRSQAIEAPVADPGPAAAWSARPDGAPRLPPADPEDGQGALRRWPRALTLAVAVGVIAGVVAAMV